MTTRVQKCGRSHVVLGMPQKIKTLCDALGFAYPAIIPGTSMYIAMETVEPVVAMEILEKYHVTNNRNPKTTRIPGLADDMRREQWFPTHQGLAVNEDALFFDGQNRLHGCIMADAPFDTLITYNVDRRAMMLTDGVNPRTIMDFAKISEKEFRRRYAAWVRVLVFGSHFGRQLSHLRTFEIAEMAAEVFTFASSEFPNHLPGRTIASVVGAICRAWFHVDRGRLAEFCQCIREATVTSQDDAVVKKLNEHLARHGLGSTGWNKHHNIYLTTENAIQHFANRTCPKVLKPARNELFPLPPTIVEAWDLVSVGYVE